VATELAWACVQGVPSQRKKMEVWVNSVNGLPTQ